MTEVLLIIKEGGSVLRNFISSTDSLPLDFMQR